MAKKLLALVIGPDRLHRHRLAHLLRARYGQAYRVATVEDGRAGMDLLRRGPGPRQPLGLVVIAFDPRGPGDGLERLLAAGAVATQATWVLVHLAGEQSAASTRAAELGVDALVVECASEPRSPLVLVLDERLPLAAYAVPRKTWLPTCG